MLSTVKKPVSLANLQIKLQNITDEGTSLYYRPELKEYFRCTPPEIVQSLEESLFGHYEIRHLETDELYGICSLYNYNLANRSVAAGIAILPSVDAGREAIIYQTMTELGNYVFNYLNYNKLLHYVLPHRRDTLGKKLESYGYVYEGRLRENLFWEGRYWDEDVYSILAEEARALHPTIKPAAKEK